MAPAGRPYWKGFLRLSLVQIAVQIHSAVEPTGSGLNQIHKPSGKRVNYTKTVPGVGPVEEADIVKGYQVSEDVYIVLEPEELEAVKLDSKKTLDLQEFVAKEEIDPRYFEAPYYLLPEDEMQNEGYRVIQAALAKMRKLGIGQITMSGREYLVAVGALEQGLAMYILRYANEVRPADAYFGGIPDVKVNPELVDLATRLIAEGTTAFNPTQFRNSYEVRLNELVQQKAKGRKVVVKTEDEDRPKGANVVDLMDALRKSIKGGKSGDKPPPVKKGGRKR
ncbi:Ku protein [Taklimakanibacter lacteus]|uniref:non-homologous end joining protein Ku n=1 Tax=Taklimakanibacter lacteus TaxID=2268456 RepID=UPI000E65F7C2